MTEQELMGWGEREVKLRKDDLKGVKSLDGLRRAQEAAEQRYKAAGLTKEQASRAVFNANRLQRRKAGVC